MMPRINRRRAKPPTKATLANYGLTLDEWLAFAESQRWTCPICRQPFGDRLLAIDHEHVRGWKAHKKLKGRKVRVMNPQQRRPFVRGILHSWCNRFVRSWLTLDRARSIVAYLEAHERRSRDQQAQA